RNIAELVQETRRLHRDEPFQSWLSAPGGDDPVHPKDQAFPAKRFRELKRLGFSDRQILVTAHGVTDPAGIKSGQNGIRVLRKSENVVPTYRLVDTCAAEFEAYTPYYYSTYG